MISGEILSRKNPLAVHIKKLGADKTYREESAEFLCDGIKLLEEAVLRGAEISAVLTAEPINFALPENTKVYNTSHDIINSVSPLKNPQKTLFICKSKIFETPEIISGKTYLLLDRIQDPGNAGTILRSASAFGIEAVFLTDGCADPHNPKTIRASMGAVFKQKTCKPGMSELITFKENGSKFIAAVLNDKANDVTRANLTGNIIVIGNEGQGISEEIFALFCDFVKIPISADCESLNAAVAASILIWEATRHPDTPGGHGLIEKTV